MIWFNRDPDGVFWVVLDEAGNVLQRSKSFDSRSRAEHHLALVTGALRPSSVGAAVEIIRGLRPQTPFVRLALQALRRVRKEAAASSDTVDRP